VFLLGVCVVQNQEPAPKPDAPNQESKPEAPKQEPKPEAAPKQEPAPKPEAPHTPPGREAVLHAAANVRALFAMSSLDRDFDVVGAGVISDFFGPVK